MRYLSVCSGIEAATVAWHPMGWTPVAFSDVDPFASAVLAHHYPNVPNYGDMTNYENWPIKEGDVDLLVGGTPCQSFSVAGLRGGLRDPRGGLMLTYLEIAKCLRPRWIVWENVPGVLSSGRGRDLGSFLGGLGELGYGWAYRVLDAQWIRTEQHPLAVPQRRRRVYVVGCLGDAASASKVLFESQSLSRDSTKSRKKGKAVAQTLGLGPVFEGELHDTVGTLCADTHPGAYSGQDAYTGRLIPCASFTKSKRAQSVNDDETWVEGEVAPTQNLFDSGDTRATTIAIDTANNVRRLTPIECERLQGFPDDYTKIPWKNKAADDCPDGPRYRAIGNSMAVNCMEWVGERINAING